MIDLETGRFILREGVEIYPGMKRDDFINSKLFEDAFFKDGKVDTNKIFYDFKTQDIDGFKMELTIHFSPQNYIDRIELTHPDFYKWPDWPKDISEKDYAYSLKKYNDQFLMKQIEGSIREGNEIWLDYDWGSITSSISFYYNPTVMITIRYNLVPILEANGEIDFSNINIDDLF